jgi:uncharacterized protein YkwD
MGFIKYIKWKIILEVFLYIITLILITSAIAGAYCLGFTGGVTSTKSGYEEYIASLLESKNTLLKSTPSPINIKALTPKPISPQQTQVNWTGPELWEAVNKGRIEHGVNPLKQADELCTIASIRLNELLELGKLDGHEGFSNLVQRRPDLKWIFDKYNISEFLVQGAKSATDVVNIWLDTLGHKKIITGGEYVWGCTYAQEGFGVAVAAY